MKSSNELKPCATVPVVGSIGIELLSVDRLAKYAFWSSFAMNLISAPCKDMTWLL
jgi:hypothetical protein